MQDIGVNGSGHYNKIRLFICCLYILIISVVQPVICVWIVVRNPILFGILRSI